jgi:hypothetical protein
LRYEQLKLKKLKFDYLLKKDSQTEMIKLNDKSELDLIKNSDMKNLLSICLDEEKILKNNL